MKKPPYFKHIDCYIKRVDDTDSYQILKKIGILTLKKFLEDIKDKNELVLHPNVRNSERLIGLEFQATYITSQGDLYASNLITLDMIDKQGEQGLVYMVLKPIYANILEQLESF